MAFAFLWHHYWLKFHHSEEGFKPIGMIKEAIMERLDTALLVKSTKRLEFKQTLYDLSENLQKYCTKLEITESENSLSYSILAQWKTEVEMFEALKEDEFKILSGAIKALCEKSTIRLNDKLVGNNISILVNLKNQSLNT